MDLSEPVGQPAEPGTPPPVSVIPGLHPASFRPHPLHGPASVWPERNCYADLWVETLHALGCDPHAMLPVVLSLDFEGDQWTFFKPSHAALWTLYGVDVQELTVWRPMADHLLDHLGAGKLLCIEADAHWMPDTAGTDYRQAHRKTSIVVTEIDLAARRLHYFHNAGFFALEGEDFDRILNLGAPAADLPLFAELIRIDRVKHLPLATLRSLSLAELRCQMERRSATNPVARFGQRYAADLPWLRAQGLAHYHAWAFGTVRQLGAAFELAARYLDWLAPADPAAQAHWAEAAAAFDEVSTGCKALILKGARAVMSPHKPFDAEAACAPLADAWARGMAALDTALAGDRLRR